MEQDPRWQPTTREKLIGATVLVVVLLVIAAYSAEWTGVPERELWDWLQLLIVPAALALGVYWLNRAQQEQALEVENQRAQDAALQAYLDQLTQLLVMQRDDSLVRMQVDDEVRKVIQARSEPLLRSLDSTRRWSLILFLSGMSLLARDRPLINLAEADLRGIDGRGAPLAGVDLGQAELRGANLKAAHLEEANLNGTHLEEAVLYKARLKGALLNGAHLEEAILSEARLEGAVLNGANLEGASLYDACLEGAHLYKACLEGAHLEGADLSGAKKLIQSQIEVAYGDNATVLPEGLKRLV